MDCSLSNRKVVITGSFINSSIGEGTSQVYEALMEGKTNFSKMKDTVYGTLFYSVCNPPKLSDLWDRKVSKVTTRKDLIAIIAALKTATVAGVKKQDPAINPDRFAIYVGSACTSTKDLSPYFSLIKKSYINGKYDPKVLGETLMSEVTPMVMLQTLMNNILCYVSVALDIRGVNTNFLDFQNSGLRALCEGVSSILSNRADIALVGGSSAVPEAFFAESLDNNKSSSMEIEDSNYKDYLYFGRNDSYPQIYPYDKKRAGTIMGEGACFLMLEEKQHAISRGASILGEITHIGVCGGGVSSMKEKYYTPTSLLGCLKGVSLNDNDLIIGYGNGSKYMDTNEARVYNDYFSNIEKIRFYSSKANLGDLAEVGGIINVALSTQILKNSLIPPTLGWEEGDNDTKRLRLSNKKESFDGDSILVTGLSFSGSACSVVVSRCS